MKNFFAIAFSLICLIMLSSCQKAVINDFEESSENVEGTTKVTFNIKQFEQVPFNKAKATRATDIKDVCSKITIAAYSGTEMVKSTSQKSTESNFGQLSLALDEGTYQVVIVGNKSGNTTTMTNIGQIKFTGGLSDTFFWSQEINVEDDNEQTVDVNMERNIAMIRFLTTDSVPENITSLKFSCKGGSSSFNGYTGIGYEKSTSQTITISIDNSMKGKPGTFEIFTFPKEEGQSTLKSIDITGLDASKNPVFTHKFENVPICRNQITIYKGKLFSGKNEEPGANSKFTITTGDTEWNTFEKDF